MIRLFQRLDGWTRPQVVLLALLLAAAVGAIQTVTPPGLSIDLFYLAPVSLAAWHAGRRGGVLLALVCAAIWLTVTLELNPDLAASVAPIWNSMMRLGTFLAVALILTNLRRLYDVEQTRARTDFLTGLYNLGAFRELAAVELARMRLFGQPLTVAFVDLDDFKAVNDREGHAAGDAVLRTVGEVLARSLRGGDLSGRIGGDEFAILLPGTGRAAAERVIRKLHAALRSGLTGPVHPVTTSIGAVVLETPPDSVDELLARADRVMYQAKLEGKDRVRFGGG